MTRNDFELIAKAVKRTRDELENHTSPLYPTATREQAAVDAVAENLASMLAGVNSRFDRVRFLDACGLPR